MNLHELPFTPKVGPNPCAVKLVIGRGGTFDPMRLDHGTPAGTIEWIAPPTTPADMVEVIRALCILVESCMAELDKIIPAGYVRVLK